MQAVGGYSAGTVVNLVGRVTVLRGAETRESSCTGYLTVGKSVVSKYTVVGWSPRRRKIQHDRGAVWASTLALLQDEHYYSRSRKQVL